MLEHAGLVIVVVLSIIVLFFARVNYTGYNAGRRFRNRRRGE